MLKNKGRRVPLRNRSGDVIAYAMVDSGDYERVMAMRWHRGAWAVEHAYGRPGRGPGCLRLHNFILPPPPGLVVDHINGNHYDNRRSNLRHVTPQQNNWNLSVGRKRKLQSKNAVLGVSWHKCTQKWRGRITYLKTMIELGVFEKKADAVAARREAERKYFGPYARSAACSA